MPQSQRLQLAMDAEMLDLQIAYKQYVSNCQSYYQHSGGPSRRYTSVWLSYTFLYSAETANWRPYSPDPSKFCKKIAQEQRWHMPPDLNDRPALKLA